MRVRKSTFALSDLRQKGAHFLVTAIKSDRTNPLALEKMGKCKIPFPIKKDSVTGYNFFVDLQHQK